MNATKFDNTRLHRESLEGDYNNRDMDALLGYFDENPMLVDYALGQTLTSIDEIREYILAQWAPASADEIRIVDLIDAGEWTVAQFVTSGVNDRQWAEFEATGRPFAVKSCNIVRWRDGKIVEDHLYYDLYGLLAQLGHAEPLPTTP